MKVQKFKGSSMKDVLIEVTKTLGKDAIILQSRKISEGGLLGIGTNSMVEVTAALDSNPVNLDTAKLTNNKEFLPPPLPLKKDYPDKRELRLITLTNQVEGLQSTLKEMSHRMQYPSNPSLPEPFGQYYTRLVDSGIEFKMASKVLLDVYENSAGIKMSDRSAIEKKIRSKISSLLTKTNKKKLDLNSPFISAVIGPTGVGKTTTIAKLATSARLYKKLKVALITADTFRIGATEQLKSFADILKIPIEVVYSSSEMKKAVNIHADKDAIFIDTTGRSPSDSENVTELISIVRAANPQEIHLVLSASTDQRTQLNALKGFGSMNVDSLIFTKLDETSRPGSIIEVALKSKKPISYLTDGQNVPQDIKVWNSDEFTDNLIKA